MFTAISDLQAAVAYVQVLPSLVVMVLTASA